MKDFIKVLYKLLVKLHFLLCIVSSACKLSLYFQESIEEHEKDRQEDSPRDFMDLYLQEIENKKDDPDSSFNSILFKLLNHF
jgi:hypothetical protein